MQNLHWDRPLSVGGLDFKPFGFYVRFYSDRPLAELRLKDRVVMQYTLQSEQIVGWPVEEDIAGIVARKQAITAVYDELVADSELEQLWRETCS